MVPPHDPVVPPEGAAGAPYGGYEVLGGWMEGGGDAENREEGG